MMDDLISRRAAIDALDFEIVYMAAYYDGKNKGNPLAQYNKGLEDGKKAIEALPSAHPEQKKGEWMLGFNNQYLEKYYYCSHCGRRQYIEHKPLDNFCPNCGAEMRKEKE